MSAVARARRAVLLRTLLAEATSGVALISGIAAVGFVLMSLLLADFSGFGPGGGNTLNIPLSLCFLLAPLLGGLAALRVGRLRIQGALDLAASTPRGRFAMLTVVAVGYFAWAVVAYLCGVVVTGVTVGVNGPWTPGMLLLPLQAWALLLAFIVLGIGIGSRLAHVLVGPGLTIVGLLGLNAIDIAADPVGRFSPIFAGVAYRYGRQPNDARIWGLLLLLLAVVVVVVAVSFYLGLVTRGIAIIAGAILLTAGTGQVLAASPDALEARTGGPGECRGREGITLCVWPGPGVQVDNALAGIVRVRDVVSTLFAVPNQFHEEGLSAASGSRAISVSPPSPQASYGIDAAIESMLPTACDSNTGRYRLELIGLVNELLRPGETSPEEPYVTGAQVASQSTTEQRAWAAPRIKALDAC